MKNFHSDMSLYPPFEETVLIDTVKVRLLEKGESTRLKKDNKNVAIGKSAQLMKTLAWLPASGYCKGKTRSIRNLFINRMGAMLPTESTHPRAYNVLFLPTKVGGFGLGFREEIAECFQRSPEPHRWFLSKLMAGEDVSAELRILRRLNTNVSRRGIESIRVLEDEIALQLEQYPTMVNAITGKELQEKFPAENFRKVIAIASDNDWLSFGEYAKRATRGNLFQSLLLNEEPLKIFKTRPFVKTYFHIWGELDKMGLSSYGTEVPWNSKEIVKAIDKAGGMYFFDTNQSTYMDIGPFCEIDDPEEIFDFQETTYNRVWSLKLPNLSIGMNFIGVRLS